MSNMLMRALRRSFGVLIASLGFAFVGGAVLGAIALTCGWEVFSGAAFRGGIALTVMAALLGGLLLSTQCHRLQLRRGNHNGRQVDSLAPEEEDPD